VGIIRRPLDIVRVNFALRESYWRVRVIDVIGSTQTDLAIEVRSGYSQGGDVLIADYQSAGRGRLNRSFVAPPQSAILFSFFIRPGRNSEDWGWLPLLAGQAVSAAIESECATTAVLELKWPNDILINHKKVAGILSERVETPDGPGIIIGIGINVTISAEELPNTSATSLALQGCENCNREDLLVNVLQKFAQYLKRWESKDTELIREYERSSATIGQRVRIDSPSGKIWESTATGIDESGGLVLASGEIITVGDIAHLKTE
jgi:BirA family biotin operon repressor/biotin-[acetyl-CoA-carboxylase] ligase